MANAEETTTTSLSWLDELDMDIFDAIQQKVDHKERCMAYRETKKREKASLQDHVKQLQGTLRRAMETRSLAALSWKDIALGLQDDANLSKSQSKALRRQVRDQAGLLRDMQRWVEFTIM
ncbi:hypothetical protein As57867_005768, partial [Aphanomyces stellatus]